MRMIVKRLELYVKSIIKGRRRGLIPSFIKLILRFFSGFYATITRIRNWFYDKGWMRRYVSPVALVISVGNIVAGGTGKTPFTLFLAAHFYGRYKIAILTRGYRSKIEKLAEPVILCEGEGPLFPPSYCGDEPYIFAQRYPKSIVIVGKNRRKSSFLAAKEGAQVILLDDGMQNRRLARDLEVVLIDAGDPFGCGHFLPRGFLREDKTSLARAHLLVINHVHSPEQFLSVKSLLQPYSNAPFIGISAEVIKRQDAAGQEIISFQNQRVGLFCTIANPEYFKRILENEGAIVVGDYYLPDHDAIKEKNLERFSQKCKQQGAAWLVCTEKDRVKLPELLITSLPIAWIQIEMKIVEGNAEWKNFLAQTEKVLS